MPDFSPFAIGDEDQLELERQWVRGLGFDLVVVPATTPPPNIPSHVCHLMSGLSPRGFGHRCVGRGGKLVWDPHPSHAGLDDLWSYTFIVPLVDPALEVVGSLHMLGVMVMAAKPQVSSPIVPPAQTVKAVKLVRSQEAAKKAHHAAALSKTKAKQATAKALLTATRAVQHGHVAIAASKALLATKKDAHPALHSKIDASAKKATAAGKKALAAGGKGIAASKISKQQFEKISPHLQPRVVKVAKGKQVVGLDPHFGMDDDTIKNLSLAGDFFTGNIAGFVALLAAPPPPPEIKQMFGLSSPPSAPPTPAATAAVAQNTQATDTTTATADAASTAASTAAQDATTATTQDQTAQTAAVAADAAVTAAAADVAAPVPPDASSAVPAPQAMPQAVPAYTPPPPIAQNTQTFSAAPPPADPGFSDSDPGLSDSAPEVAALDSVPDDPGDPGDQGDSDAAVPNDDSDAVSDDTSVGGLHFLGAVDAEEHFVR